MKFNRESFSKLSVSSDKKWFQQIPDVPSEKPAPPDIVSSLKAEAQKILDSETKLYHRLKESQRDKDFVWVQRILKTGTLSDKVSALSMLIENNSVYYICHAEALIAMVNIKGKRECLMAMDALRDIFPKYLLVEGRKLKPFRQQSLDQLDVLCDGCAQTRKRFLVLWLFEDLLESLYKRFLVALEKVSHDTLDQTKLKAVTIMAHLMKENPQEEQFLLERLVNKMGDPIPKVGSHACFHLGTLLSHHPVMKNVVAEEVERLVFRPNLSERAKYYALIFLSQIILSQDEWRLANRLISIYFGQFKASVRKGDVDNKIMKALLTGASRAYPYAKLKDDVLRTQLDAMYKLVHLVSFNLCVQALMLIFQVLDSSDEVSARFYNVLYRKLLDQDLSICKCQALFLSLVYRAVKKDVAILRIRAILRRILQMATCMDPSLECGILLMVSQASQVHAGILDTKKKFIEDDDSDEHYEDAPDEEDADPNQPSVVKQPQTKQATKAHAFEDVNCRNPLHSKTNGDLMWELTLLQRNYHPSVSHFAHQVANQTHIKYSGDPLQDFTTAKFLDRFVYRNPKQAPPSLQKDPRAKVFGRRKLKTKQSLVVTSQEFLQAQQSNIPVEERFLYQYMKQKAATTKAKADEESDVESVCSEDFNDLLDKILVEDDADDSLNFARELGLHKQRKSAKGKESDEDDDSEDDLEGESDIEDDLDLDEADFDKAFDEEDMCENDFIGEDDEDRPRKKKKKGQEDANLLADAEEFSALLEEENEDIDTQTSQAFKKDKSSAKQLKWEKERHHSLHGKRKNTKFSKNRKNKRQRKS